MIHDNNLKQNIWWHIPFKELAHQIKDRNKSGILYHEQKTKNV